VMLPNASESCLVEPCAGDGSAVAAGIQQPM
jgi:hypothetical protein